MHPVHNARVQLLATMLNNLGVAFMVAGFVAPLVSGQVPFGGGILVFVAWFGIGIVLHFFAQGVLGRLRQ